MKKTALLVAVGFLGVTAQPSLAQSPGFDAQSYFSGKTITIQVGFSAGGGTDLQARHFAASWGDFMPGRPRFRVTNIRPNIASANRLYKSKPDGLILELTGSPNVINQFAIAQSQFKVEENRIIGSHVGALSVLFGHKGLPYKTLREAMGGKQVIRMGWRRPTQGGAMRMAALSEWLNIPMKFIPGASGTSDSLLELERGDTNAWIPGGAGTAWFGLPTIRPGWLKGGTIRPLALMGDREAKIPGNKEIEMPADVPYAADLIKDPEKKRQYLAFSNLIDRYSKIFMAAPKTPDPIIEAFRKSYRALLADKVFAQKLEVLQGDLVEFTPGEKIEKDLDQMVKDYKELEPVFKTWQTWAKARF
jgi:tripartite-type tricarboxylate transporter receptor subunit TctC